MVLKSDKIHLNRTKSISHVTQEDSRSQVQTAEVQVMLQEDTQSFHFSKELKFHRREMTSEKRILKNVIVVCLTMLLLYTAFNGIRNLQSTINCTDGLGTASLTALYAGLTASSLFLPTLSIQKIGLRWTMAVSCIGYMIYIVCNFYPEFYTLIPAGVIAGFAAGTLWSAKAQYITVSALEYAKVTNKNKDAVIAFFFGIFFCIYQLNQIFGNLISSIVLGEGLPSFGDIGNATQSEIETIKNSCGINQPRPTDNGSSCSGSEIPSSTINLLMGIYTGVSAVSFLLAATVLDNLPVHDQKKSALKLATSAFQHLISDSRQTCLSIITLYSGMEQAFFIDSFTSSFINCGFGPEWIGYIMIFYGVGNSLFSFIWGYLDGKLGRVFVFISGFILNLVLILSVIFEWVYPNPNHIEWLFIYGVGWGACDAVWQSNIHSLHGSVFVKNQEAAFSNYRLFKSIGSLIAFGYANTISTAEKVYICLGTLIVGIIGYILCEIIHARRYKINDEEEEQKSYLQDEVHSDKDTEDSEDIHEL